MKRAYLILLPVCLLCACSNPRGGDRQEVLQQIQYDKTHTGYAGAATLNYALDHGITPDSAIVVLGSAKQ